MLKPYKRGSDEWYVKCKLEKKRCQQNCKDCFCAVFKTKKGSNKRKFHGKGNEKGKVRIPSKQAGTREWYCYCVKS